MKIKPVIPREQANQDVDDAIAHYLEEASSSVALGFIDALERGYTHIGRHPGTGSPRHGHELDLPGLVVPHPRLAQRRFVLAPLADLRPSLVVPGTGRTVAQLLEAAPPARVVRA